MNDLIAIFRMSEVSAPTRITILKELGVAINRQYGANLTERLVIELVLALDPMNPIKEDEHYKRYL